MTNTNMKMRKGFTMIELIFVIVIIGILAAVAIPKLAANRDDAEASTCVHEVGQFVQELSASYTKLGNAGYIAAPISDVTNISTGQTVGSVGKKGIVQAGTVTLGTGAITYKCDDKVIATITGANAGTDYNLSVAVTAAPGTPASQKAADGVLKNIGGVTPKIYTL